MSQAHGTNPVFVTLQLEKDVWEWLTTLAVITKTPEDPKGEFTYQEALDDFDISAAMNTFLRSIKDQVTNEEIINALNYEKEITKIKLEKSRTVPLTQCGMNEEVIKLLKTTFRTSYETLTILKNTLYTEKEQQAKLSAQVKEVTEKYLKTVFIQKNHQKSEQERKEDQDTVKKEIQKETKEKQKEKQKESKGNE